MTADAFVEDEKAALAAGMQRRRGEAFGNRRPQARR